MLPPLLRDTPLDVGTPFPPGRPSRAVANATHIHIIRGVLATQHFFQRVVPALHTDTPPRAAIRCQNAIHNTLAAAVDAYLMLHGRQVETRSLSQRSLSEHILTASRDTVEQWFRAVAAASASGASGPSSIIFPLL